MPPTMEEAFTLLCDLLRRNDPSKATLQSPRSFPANYGTRLGDALLGNTHVEHVAFDVSHGFIDTPTSIIHESSISSILQFLREGAALRCVELSGETSHYVGLCLRALSQNPSITTLSLIGTTSIPTVDMLFFLANSQALKTILLPLNSVDQVVANALETTRTIQDILLDQNCAIPPCINEVVLQQLVSRCPVHKVRFRDMQKFFRGLDIALSTLLTQTSGPLRCLCLRGYLDLRTTECLVDSLHGNTSLKHLTLACKMDVEASHVFASYMQQSGQDGKVLSYHLTIDACFVPTMLLGSCGLRSLEWHCCKNLGHHVAGFWKMLGDNASDIRLSCLIIQAEMPTGTVELMCESIPKLIYLRQLHLFVEFAAKELRNLVKAVHQNGSLHHCCSKQTNCTSKGRDFATHWATLAFQRNANLPDLILKMTSMETSNGVDAIEDDSGWHRATNGLNELPNVVTSCNCKRETSWNSLYPTLFAVAQQSPWYAPNWILMGLVQLYLEPPPEQQSQEESINGIYVRTNSDDQDADVSAPPQQQLQPPTCIQSIWLFFNMLIKCLHQ